MFGVQSFRFRRKLLAVTSLHTREVKLPSVENEKPIRVGEGGSLSRTDPCEMQFFCNGRLFAKQRS